MPVANDIAHWRAQIFARLLLVVFLGLCRVLFRSAFRYDPDRAAQIAALHEGDAIRDRRLLALGLAVLGAVTAALSQWSPR